MREDSQAPSLGLTAIAPGIVMVPSKNDGVIGLTGEQAITVGKLLRAEVFVAIEPDTTQKGPVGVVVFDAQSGLRLADAALPTDAESAAAAVADAVIMAVRKRGLPLDGGAGLRLLAVRNADLPVAMGPLCEAVQHSRPRYYLEIVQVERSHHESGAAALSFPTGKP